MDIVFDRDNRFDREVERLIGTTNLYATPSAGELAPLKDYLFGTERQLFELAKQGASGTSIVKGITTLVDRLIADIFQWAIEDFEGGELESLPVAVVALGGYGRAELNPHSDIDLLIIYDDPAARAEIEAFTNKILYPIWDLGLTLGHSIRTIKDNVELSSYDLNTRTSLIDRRFIVGDIDFYRTFSDEIFKRVIRKGMNGFINDKLSEIRKRHGKFGDSVYLLEPNLKEGKGGLRDIHTLLWIGKIIYNAADFKDILHKGGMSTHDHAVIESSMDYLLRIRNFIHFIGNRKNDTLSFELQEQIAELLGYTDTSVSLGVEHFMKDFYINAINVSSVTDKLLADIDEEINRKLTAFYFVSKRDLGNGFKLYGKKITVGSPETFADDPSKLVLIFTTALELDVQIHRFAREEITKAVASLDRPLYENPRAVAAFRAFLTARGRKEDLLRAMNELGVLGSLIPEFSDIFCKVQHDIYHLYTVDVHLIKAVAELDRLALGDYVEQYPNQTKLIGRIANREILYMATLLHDIGKGQGKSHAQRGATMCYEISKRFGYSTADTELLSFLVHSHLTMSQFAQRRDLTDVKLIVGFARTMRTNANLNLLYLLTFADINAVGPGLFTKWKAMLIDSLYFEARNVIDEGAFSVKRANERIPEIRAAVESILRAKGRRDEEIATLFGPLTSRYWLSNSNQEIVEHLEFLRGFGDRPFDAYVKFDLETAISEIVIAGYDSPGLFSRVAGTFTAYGLNILNVQMNVMRDQSVLDVYYVEDKYGKLGIDKGRWIALKEALEKAHLGITDVEALVKDKELEYMKYAKVRPKVPSEIVIDNDISESFTVIDVIAQDTIGILFAITRFFYRNGISVYLAKISTEGDKVFDVFYVKDILSSKITDERKIATIREGLMNMLEAPSDKPA